MVTWGIFIADLLTDTFFRFFVHVLNLTMAADKYIYADRPESSVGRSGGKIKLRMFELKRDQNADEEPRDIPKERENPF
jgi:hypothetical protein